MYFKVARFGFCMLAAALAASYLEPLFAVVLGGFFLFSAVFLSVITKKLPAVKTALFAMGFGAVLIGAFMFRSVAPLQKLNEKTVKITGVVTEISTEYGNPSYTVQTSSVELEGALQKVSVQLSGYGDYGFAVGDRVAGTVSFLPSAGKTVPELFHEEAGALSLFAYPQEDFTVLEKDVYFKGKYLSALRGFLSGQISRFFSGWHAAFTKDLLLGIRDELPRGIKNAFRRSGMSHLLVVSGMHLTIMIGCLEEVIQRKSRSLRKKSRETLILIAVTVAYMALVGFGSSVMRAGIMLIVCLLIRRLFAHTDPIENLGAAIVIVLLLDPSAICDGGFLMSVLSAASIIFFKRPVTYYLMKKIRRHKTRRILRPLFGAFSLSLVAWLATMPVAVVLYDSLSLVAPFSNLFSSVLTEATLVFSFFSLLSGFIPFLSPLAEGNAFLAELSENLLCRIASFFADLPIAYLHIRQEWLLLWLFGSAFLLLFPVVLKKARRYLRTAALLSTVLILLGMGSERLLFRDTVKTEVTALKEGTAITCSYGNSSLVLTHGLTASDPYLLEATGKETTLILLDSEKAFAEQSIFYHLDAKEGFVTFEESALRQNSTAVSEGKVSFGRESSVRFTSSFAEIDTGGILVLYIFENCDIIEIDPRFRRADIMILENVMPDSFPGLSCQTLILRDMGGYYSGSGELFSLPEGKLCFYSRGQKLKKGWSFL